MLACTKNIPLFWFFSYIRAGCHGGHIFLNDSQIVLEHTFKSALSIFSVTLDCSFNVLWTRWLFGVLPITWAVLATRLGDFQDPGFIFPLEGIFKSRFAIVPVLAAMSAPFIPHIVQFAKLSFFTTVRVVIVLYRCSASAFFRNTEQEIK
ncbi:uncharacterized protein BYT42DRAFT_568998 [Radiomyces spectabilis]|uniref:uncharacterized protein n=1 Tax=Radiomyces spectabilis TaxID=64574 RepID=UPI00221E46D7|nr:uncharacterized protein BYT42DRAFT_568998 [Radiomyces spectabilis]KAI8379502.1 hypothetical protein BYT42DRAFT_568998 [Radiomyces spectabilis]